MDVVVSLDEKSLYELILSDDLTYERLIINIIKEQKLDPWDIDLEKLANRYLEVLKTLKKINFRVSGKFLVAAAILLRMKSDALTKQESEQEPISVSPLDRETLKMIKQKFGFIPYDQIFIPKVPLPKKRGITIEDLFQALHSAMEIKEKKDVRKSKMRTSFNMEIKKVNMLSLIKKVYEKIVSIFKKEKKEKISFNRLIKNYTREEIIWTILPLLHLANQHKVGLEQKEQFGDIFITRGVKYEE
ncbi:hypothetical protein DRN75_01585 [Nanoarchaeota archaeon]|nr:MAG: hypothetical protein DRN75_01585 [Nanoarchaeota archaeon]